MAKVIFWGHPVGKTRLIERLLDSDFTFSEEYCPTSGIDFKIQKFGNSSVQIWDSSGQKKWQNFTRAYLHNLNAVFLCFDPRDKNSFEFLKLSLDKIKEAEKVGELILIETKSDLAGYKKVEEKEINQFKEKNNIHHHIKTSAKTGQGLAETSVLLNTLAKSKPFVIEDKTNCDSFLLNTFYAVAAISSIALLITAAVTFCIPLIISGLLVGGAGLIVATSRCLFFAANDTQQTQTKKTANPICCEL